MAEPRFIIDKNVGKLVKWLRMMGYDSVLFDETDDGRMVKLALAQGRIIVTRDTEFMKRRTVTSGRVKAVLVAGDDPQSQMRVVMNVLCLEAEYKPFTRCIECNVELQSRDRQQVAGTVPPRVYEIQDQYMQCPHCHRIFWRGTHWQAMSNQLRSFISIES